MKTLHIALIFSHQQTYTFLPHKMVFIKNIRFIFIQGLRVTFFPIRFIACFNTIHNTPFYRFEFDIDGLSESPLKTSSRFARIINSGMALLSKIHMSFQINQLDMGLYNLTGFAFTPVG